ncbi:MAG: hypothetical protein CMJ18_23355 [Phycisphaeraceae bacterium]|nr:hypothetical protein [Phycisphaeraceae bacterium]
MSWFDDKTLLVPTDFSEGSLQAVRHARDLVSDVSRLHVLHVVTPIGVDGLEPVSGTATRDETLVRRALKHLRDELEDPVFAGSQMNVQAGDPGLVIADEARRVGADLIVMPSHGYSGVKHLLLGSVAERVVRCAPCPVLVLRLDDAAEEIDRIISGPQPVLAPVDFSEASVHAAVTARKIVSDVRSLHVVHVLTPAAEQGPEVVYGDATEPELRRRRLEQLRRQFSDADLSEATFTVVPGRAGLTIAGHARQIGAEMIVIASHGYTGLKHLLLGSVAERVLRHAPCSVLVLRRDD